MAVFLNLKKLNRKSGMRLPLKEILTTTTFEGGQIHSKELSFNNFDISVRSAARLPPPAARKRQAVFAFAANSQQPTANSQQPTANSQRP